MHASSTYMYWLEVKNQQKQSVKIVWKGGTGKTVALNYVCMFKQHTRTYYNRKLFFVDEYIVEIKKHFPIQIQLTPYYVQNLIL